jgi:beta-galactosidase/beta-glucuronidase
MKRITDKNWNKAIVPGDITSSLEHMQHSINPFSMDTAWEYRTFFDLDKAFLAGENIDLLCGTICGKAKIYLNDHILISGSGSIKIQVPCKSYLKLKGNRLKVIFKAPVKPADGIWEPVKLRSWHHARIENTNFYLTYLSEKFAQYNAEITIVASSDIVSNIDILVNQKHVIKIRDLSLTKGVNKQWISFNIRNPKLWWANGMEFPNLQEFTIRLQANGKIIQEYQQPIGIRKLEQEKTDNNKNSTFCYKLNYRPFHIKGVCYQPPVTNLSDNTLNNYKQIIEAARNTNINLIYVANPVFFGKELFISLCEENGILFYFDSTESFLNSSKFSLDKGKITEKIYFNPVRFGFPSASSVLYGNKIFLPLKKAPNNYANSFRDSYLDTLKKFYNPSVDWETNVYYSQILQSDIIKATVESSRIQDNNTCGLLYNQFNDLSYSQSESVLDYDGNWKPSNYKLRDAFASCIIVPVYNQGKVEVYIVNDEWKEIDGILLCKQIDFYGNDYYVKQIPVTIKANSVLKAVTVDKNELFRKTTEYKSCFLVQLSRPGQTVAQNLLYFSVPKDLQLPAVNLKPDVNMLIRNFNLIFKSDVLVKNVVLDTKKQRAVFSDNNFDLLPGKRTKISVMYNGTQQQLISELGIKYLNPRVTIKK